MSESLRKVVGLVGLAAIGFATFGAGAALFASFGSLGLGGALGSTAILGLTNLQLLAVGASLIAASRSPRLESTGANSRSAPLMDPNAVGAFVFGTTTAPMQIVYEEQHNNEPDRQITDVFAHCWHRIQSYQSLYLGGDEGPELVTFSGEASNGAFANMLWWFRADGTQTLSLQDTHTAPQMNNNSWPSSAVFEGVAHSAILWNIDDAAFVDKYSAIPQRIDCVVQGAWLYDPRLDPSYGSGTQDFGDPTTWSFNNGNAALVLLRFLIGEYSDGGDLIWGRGAAESDINMDSFVAMANIADETVDSKPRFRLGGMHVLDGSFDGFVGQWESETGGKLSKAGGIYEVWLPNDDLTPVTGIEEDDLLAGVPVGHTVAGDIGAFYNTARGRYIEPAEGYKGLPYPEVSEASAVADEGKRILHQDFSWVQDQSIAERISRIKVRRSRFQRVWTIALDWRGQGPNFRPFTVHTLTCKETNNTNQLVRVIDRRMSFIGVTILTLQEENASIYDDTIALGTGATTNTIANRLDRVRSINIPSPGGLLGEVYDSFSYSDETEFLARWSEYDNGGAGEVALVSDTTAPGGTALRFGDNSGNDEYWAWFSDFLIPYDGLSLYEVGVVARRLTGAGEFYCGLEGVASDGVTMFNAVGSDTHTGQHYFAASAVDPTTSFQTYRGFVRGWSGTPSVDNRNDPQNPGQMFTGSVYVRPLFITNYDNVAGQTEIAALWVRRIEGDLAAAAASDLVYRQSTAPANPIEGWIWVDTDDLRVYRWSGAAWVQIATDDALLATSNAPAESGADATSGHADDIIFRQSTAPGSPATGWIWVDTDDFRVYRWSGSAWVQIAADDALLIGTNAPSESGADVTDNQFTSGAESTYSPASYGGFAGGSEPSITFTYLIVGEWVHIWVSATAFGTSNANTFTILDWPSALRTSSGLRDATAWVVDNGATQIGRLRVGTTSSISIVKGDGSLFTTSGNKGLTEFATVYRK